MLKRPETDSCFILMPFGAPFDAYYQEILVPAIHQSGLSPIRADEIHTPGAITQQIWEGIRMAAMCVADITGRNANVMYEVGLAHACGKPVISIVQDVNDLPFDLRSYRHIVYETASPSWAETLRQQLEKALGETLADSSKALVFPVATAAGGRIVLDNATCRRLVELHQASAAFRITKVIDDALVLIAEDPKAFDIEDFFRGVRSALLESRHLCTGFTNSRIGDLVQFFATTFPESELRELVEQTAPKMLQVRNSVIKRNQLLDRIWAIQKQIYDRLVEVLESNEPDASRPTAELSASDQ